MTELEILHELNLPVFAVRPPSLPLVVFIAENQAKFSALHHTQLDKILAFLNFSKADYTLVFKDMAFSYACQTLLCFGEPPIFVAEQCIATYSISAMLQNPACKREVLHAIRSLQKA